ncbi:tetratricopeptide repeat protein [Aquimarina sp. SS2-1]|uniref:tetratricopeptide repeat protein n=1 Tax=Aquimarina besae TaxID=3342247 RepID=UPI00366A907C
MNPLRKGKILFDLGRYEEAIAYFKTTIQMFPDADIAKYLIGLSHYNLKKNELAFSIAEELIGNQPDQYYGYYLKSILLIRKQEYLQALDFIESGLRLDPNMVLLLNEKGYILMQLDRIDYAFEVIKQSLKIDPKNAETLNLKAKLLSRKEYRRGETMRTLRSSLQISPDDEDTHRAAAIVHLRLGNLSASKKHIIEALRKDPSDRDVLKFLYHIEVFEHWFFSLFEKVYNYCKGPNKWSIASLFLLFLGSITLFLLINNDYSIIHFTPVLSILVLGSIYGYLLDPIHDVLFYVKKEKRDFLSIPKKINVVIFLVLSTFLFLFPIIHTFNPKSDWSFKGSIITAVLFNILSRFFLDWEDTVKTTVRLIALMVATSVFATHNVFEDEIKYYIFFVISGVYYALYFFIDSWRRVTFE